jgi:uncharacterized protein
MDTALAAKEERLRTAIRSLEAAVVAYSGGVDSALVAAVAHEELAERALAVTAVSPSLARRELDAAKALAAERGWNHKLIGTKEVIRERYARNDPDRCYWCKTELFDALLPLAQEMNAAIVTGTNAEDLGDYRPGLAAAQEHGVRAPLAEAGLAKAEVRELSARLGLPTADKPASPCLASRFAYGVRVTPAGLRRIERAEEVVRKLGFGDLRVRDHGDLARIEVPARDIPRAAILHEEIAEALGRLGFAFVTLDLKGFRSGSLNQVLQHPTIRRSSAEGAEG